jgi:outer membrane protein TolC
MFVFGNRLPCRIYLITFVLLTGGSAFAEETRLSLSDAVELALTVNENALIARERLTRAKNARSRARAAFLPVLKAGGTFTHSDREIGVSGRVIQRQDAFAGGATLGVTLFSGPAVPTASQARLLAASEEARVAWERNLLAHDTAEVYFSVLASERLVDAAERTRDTALELLDAVKARREAGEALGIDQNRAEFEVISAEEALVRAKNARDSAMDYLAFLIDRPPPLVLENVEVRPSPDRSDAALVDTALKKRPDLRSAEREVAAADKGVKAAWMDFLPSLSAAGNYRVTQNTGWSGDADSWNIVLALDWILYDGGLRRAEKSDRESNRTVARLKKRLLERTIRNEVRQALRDLDSAEATLKTAREKERLARQNHEAVRERYRSGLATSLEVVQADDDLVQSETGAILESLNLSLRRLDLLKSLGLDPNGREVAPL